MPQRRPKVFMIGPSLKTQGGISSVLDIYSRDFRESLNLCFIPSYSGRSRILDMLLFAGAFFRVLWASLFSVNPIFHIHMASNGSYLRKSILARICLARGHRLILHIHGAMFDQFMERAGSEKKKKIITLLNKANRVIVLSGSWFSFFEKYVPGERLRVIYNPSSTYSSGQNRAYKTGNVQAGGSTLMKVLFMGRFGQRKGAYDLIRAAAKLREVPFMLDMYGDGEIEKVRELVEKENLKEKVSINGWVPHSKIWEIYENADVMALPSYAEGLPMSLLEAVGEGLPVVSTRVGGIPEVVEDGRNGFLIEPGDVEALADRLRRLVTSPEMAERMGRESLNIAREKFSTDRIGQELQQLYQELEG
jgi:glycosyltransferase involved in cell wall biosynthesis